jgi:protein-S-isoprenylcysteine O-methyltransferase Ste14
VKNPGWKVYARYFTGVFFLGILTPCLPLLISQHWNWWGAWVYVIICILGVGISRGLASWHNPGLLAERAHIMQQEDAKSWDKLILPLWSLSFVLIMIVAGLDELLNWSSSFSSAVIILSLFIFSDGYVLGSYAMYENRFFSGMARIQTEREHKVVSSGPYAWVRHPGYAGSLISSLATPFCLESWWACIPTLILVAVLIERTKLEDLMLQNELEGYRAYSQHVRYRLIPGIW